MKENVHTSSEDRGNQPFEPHPEHADDIRNAIAAIQNLAEKRPEFAATLRQAETTEEARLVLLDYGIKISGDALWRHRGSLLKDGHPTWRG